MRTAATSLFVGIFVLAMTMSGVPAFSQESVDETFESLASCFNDRDHMLVLALMDESGSLRQTDPEDQRVTALETALTNLAGLRSLAGEDSTVEIGVAGFAAEFEMVVPWQDLNEQTSSDVRQQARRFADRDNGLDTDFALALQGAQRELATRASEVTADGEAAPCRVLLMFTDGAYDIEPRSSGETKPYAPDLPLDVEGNDVRAEEAGKALICDPGGVADSIRSTGTPIVTIAFSAQIEPADQDFLGAVSVGEAGSETCGEIREPDMGVYIPADDLTALLVAFDRVTGRMLGGKQLDTESEVPICQREACAEGRQEFELDKSLRQAHVLADLVADGVVAQFEGPSGGDPVTFDASEVRRVEHSGAVLAVTPLSETVIVVDATLPPDNDEWVGTWSVTFIDTTGQNPGAIARTQIILFGALEPAIVGDPAFRLGEQSRAEVQVVDQEGTPRTPTDFVADARITATITDPLTGQQQEADVSGPDDEGRWTVMFTPPMELESTAVNLSATLDVETRSGVSLQPRTTNRSIPILPPATYPTVSPAELSLGTLDGPGSLTGTLTVSGSEENGGCVWFEPGEIDKPRYSGDITTTFSPDATSEGQCAQVGAGETRDIEVSFSTSEVGDGSVQAPLTVHLRSEASPDVLSRTLPASFEMLRPVDQIRRLGFFLAILLPGLLLPFVLMYLLNWWNARFHSPGFSRHARIPVRVTAEERLLRRDATGDWRPFELRADDLSTSGGPPGVVRGFTADGLHFEAKTPLNPFRESYAVASANGAPVVSTDGTVARDGTPDGRLGFELPNTWAFVARDVEHVEDAPDDERPFDVLGDLHVWLEEAPFAEQGPRMIDRVVTDVPPAARSLGEELWRRRAREPKPPATTEDDSGYSPPSANTDGGSAWTPPSSSEGRGASEWRPPSASQPSGTPPAAPSPTASEDGPRGYTPPSSATPPDDRDETTRGDDSDGPPAWRPPHEHEDQDD